MHEKLVSAGLATPRAQRGATGLGDFVQSYIGSRTDIKQRTRENLENAKRRLIEVFGKDRPLDTITVGDAKDFHIKLKERYAPSTLARTLKWAKQFFQAAIDKELINRNPFAKIKAHATLDAEKIHFIPRDVAYKVIEACPDAEWRLLFALSRFGGLAPPSGTWLLHAGRRGLGTQSLPGCQSQDGAPR